MHQLEFRYELARHFKCTQCGSQSASTEIFSLSGEKKKKLSDYDIFDMILAVCKSCGQLITFDKFFLPETNVWENKLEH